MTTRAGVNRLGSASKRLVEAAKAELVKAFGLLDLSSPADARDALLDIVPVLSRRYGDMAALVAADWYEETRAAQVDGDFTAALAASVPDIEVAGSVRFAAGHLFTDTPERSLAVLLGALQRNVMHSARETIASNAASDPARPRYARVPAGAKTCAWCEMLASRGFDYGSANAAGASSAFHDDCDCQIVVSFDANKQSIAGYDPDALYERYQAAVDAAGSTDPSDVVAAMRRLYPGQFTDGVHQH